MRLLNVFGKKGIQGRKSPRRKGGLLRAALGVGRWALRFPKIAAFLICWGGISVLWHLEPFWQWAHTHWLTYSQQRSLALREILVEGRHQTKPQEIAQAVGVRQGESLFLCLPEQAKKRLEQLAWVRSAIVQRHFPGTLYIRLTERTPIALWQKQAKLYLVDEEGKVISQLDAKLYSYPLLLVVGEGAPAQAPSLLKHLKAFPNLSEKVGSAVLVRGRRWDLLLKGKSVRIKLPIENIEHALQRLQQLEHDHQIMQGHIQIIDLRTSKRSFLFVAPKEEEESKKGKST